MRIKRGELALQDIVVSGRHNYGPIRLPLWTPREWSEPTTRHLKATCVTERRKVARDDDRIRIGCIHKFRETLDNFGLSNLDVELQVYGQVEIHDRFLKSLELRCRLVCAEVNI